MGRINLVWGITVGVGSFFGIILGLVDFVIIVDIGEGTTWTGKIAGGVAVTITWITDSLTIFSSEQETKEIQKIQNIIFNFFISFINLFR